MNPPRVELEFAIRSCLKKLGVNVKIPKSAFSTKEQKKDKKPAPEKDKSAKKQKKASASKKSAKAASLKRKATQAAPQLQAAPVQLANSVMPPLNGTQTVKEAAQL